MNPPATRDGWMELADRAARAFPMRGDDRDHPLFDSTAFEAWQVTDAMVTLTLICGLPPGRPLEGQRLDASLVGSCLMAATRQGIGIGIVMAREGMVDGD